MSDYPEMHWDADAGQWVPPASQPAETQRHGDPGASGPGLALAQTAVHPLSLDSAFTKTFAIGAAAAVAAGIAACLIPRAASPHPG
jgi:hypothetical protein